MGLVLLTLGRKLFWLFVACVGFVAGFCSARYFWGSHSDLMILLIAITLGLLGAALAIYLQAVAIILAGFIAGGYVATNVMILFGFETSPMFWLPYAVGGIIGAVLLFLLFDWALIFLSSLCGAFFLIQAVQLRPLLERLLFTVLFFSGAIFQAGLWRQRRPQRAHTSGEPGESA
jgi:hypothetical protein